MFFFKILVQTLRYYVEIGSKSKWYFLLQHKERGLKKF